MKKIKKLLFEQKGVGTLEMILIAAVLVSIAVLFSNEITEIVNGLLSNLGSETDKIFQ
ncbi:MAG: Flp1 family type IVb pilin [Bacillota bacterium]